MQYKVYHAKQPTFGFGKQPAFSECEHVATVETDELGKTFVLTNHIEDAWQKNPEVIWAKQEARSTSVGDIVEDGNGKRFRCESIGWSEITRK